MTRVTWSAQSPLVAALNKVCARASCDGKSQPGSQGPRSATELRQPCDLTVEACAARSAPSSKQPGSLAEGNVLDDQPFATPQERPALSSVEVVNAAPLRFGCEQPLQPCQLQSGRLRAKDSVMPKRGFECESDWPVWRGGRVVYDRNLLHQVRDRLGDDEIIENCTCSSCMRDCVEHQLSRFPRCDVGRGNCPGCFLM